MERMLDGIAHAMGGMVDGMARAMGGMADAAGGRMVMKQTAQETSGMMAPGRNGVTGAMQPMICRAFGMVKEVARVVLGTVDPMVGRVLGTVEPVVGAVIGILERLGIDSEVPAEMRTEHFKPQLALHADREVMVIVLRLSAAMGADKAGADARSATALGVLVVTDVAMGLGSDTGPGHGAALGRRAIMTIAVIDFGIASGMRADFGGYAATHIAMGAVFVANIDLGVGVGLRTNLGLGPDTSTFVIAVDATGRTDSNRCTALIANRRIAAKIGRAMGSDVRAVADGAGSFPVMGFSRGTGADVISGTGLGAITAGGSVIAFMDTRSVTLAIGQVFRRGIRVVFFFRMRPGTAGNFAQLIQGYSVIPLAERLLVIMLSQFRLTPNRIPQNATNASLIRNPSKLLKFG